MIRTVAIASLIFFDIFIGHGQDSRRSLQAVKEAEKLLVHDPVAAERILREMTDRTGNSNDPELKGMAHRVLATLYASQSRKKDEIEHLFKSYWYFKSTENIGALAEAERLIGDYYLQMRLLEQASDYFNSALSQAIAGREMRTQIKTIEGLAQLASAYEKNNEALLLHEEGLSLSRKIRYRRALLEHLYGMALVYEQMGEPEKMLEHTRSAIGYRTENADTAAMLYRSMGVAYLQTGQLDSADFYLGKGLALSRQGKNKIEEMKL